MLGYLISPPNGEMICQLTRTRGPERADSGIGSRTSLLDARGQRREVKVRSRVHEEWNRIPRHILKTQAGRQVTTDDEYQHYEIQTKEGSKYLCVSRVHNPMSGGLKQPICDVLEHIAAMDLNLLILRANGNPVIALAKDLQPRLIRSQQQSDEVDILVGSGAHGLAGHRGVYWRVMNEAKQGVRLQCGVSENVCQGESTGATFVSIRQEDVAASCLVSICNL